MFGLMRRERTPAPLARVETPFGWFPEEFTRMFNRMVPTWPFEEMNPWGFTMEENEKEVTVRAELPGFEPAEVKVELAGERLTITAEHKEPAEEKEKTEKKPERAYAHVKRELTLPAGVEGEKAAATFRNGVLEVHLPRKPELMPHRIEVKT
jgi:HSP20 family protein